MLTILCLMLNRGLQFKKMEENVKEKKSQDKFPGREALHRNLVILKGWAITNHMMFNKDMCQILYLGQGKPWLCTD